MANWPPVTTLWITQDGREMRICDMDDDHLINSINLIYRRCEGEHEFVVHSLNSDELASISTLSGKVGRWLDLDVIEMDPTPHQNLPDVFYDLTREYFRRYLGFTETWKV